MKHLVVAAFWMDDDDGDHATQTVADAVAPFRAKGSRGATVAFNEDHSQIDLIVADLARFDLAEIAQR